MPVPTLRYLSRNDVESLALPMKEIIEAVEAAFREKGEGTAEMPPKPGVHPLEDAFIHAMPAFLGGMGAAGMKWVSGFPQNPDRGLPYISGLFVLNDVETGLPLSVMDCTWITGARTGAAIGGCGKIPGPCRLRHRRHCGLRAPGADQSRGHRLCLSHREGPCV